MCGMYASRNICLMQRRAQARHFLLWKICFDAKFNVLKLYMTTMQVFLGVICSSHFFVQDQDKEKGVLIFCLY